MVGFLPAYLRSLFCKIATSGGARVGMYDDTYISCAFLTRVIFYGDAIHEVTGVRVALRADTLRIYWNRLKGARSTPTQIILNSRRIFCKCDEIAPLMANFPTQGRIGYARRELQQVDASMAFSGIAPRG